MTALGDILVQHPWLVYVFIISVSALIGWGTNWLAVKMTFYPLDFVGIKSIRLGWQGLIPYHSQKIGQKTVDLITQKLLPPQELVQTIDPKLLSKSVRNEQKRKKKSAEKWEKREAFQKEQMADRQKKRKDNLKSRVKAKIERKIDKREKKRNRPGFEGRSQGPINK